MSSDAHKGVGDELEALGEALYMLERVEGKQLAIWKAGNLLGTVGHYETWNDGEYWISRATNILYNYLIRANPSPPAEEVKIPVPSDVVVEVALALYECEKRRAAHCSEVLSEAAGKCITDKMEPWEECKDTFLSDAKAAIAAMPSHEATQKLIDLKAENERLRADLEHALDTVKAVPEQRDALLDLADRIQELHKICIEKGIIHDKY